MTIQEKLNVLLSASGMSQQEAANRLGVTVVALNRWVNEKAVPRPSAVQAIDALYREVTGEKPGVTNKPVDAKKLLVTRKARRQRNILGTILKHPDIRDQLVLSLTYSSNRIEGSTLSERETAAILFQNKSLPGKTLLEQLEAKNHQAALEHLFGHLARGGPVNEALILKMHGILMNAVRDDAGRYRTHGVRIVGSNVPTANPVKVPELMAQLDKRIQRADKDIVRQIAEVHAHFEKVHPFGDGNGRVGRLLMHAMALRSGLAPVSIAARKRSSYLTRLRNAQLGRGIEPLEELVCDGILESFRAAER
jgi:Fic family protein